MFKNKIIKSSLIIIGFAIVVYAAYFAYQVYSYKNQILAGEFVQYQTNVSGDQSTAIKQMNDLAATADDPAIGPATAKVTIVEFGDFECPFCRESFPVIRRLAQEYGDDVRFIYRDFPLDDIHKNARLAAQAGYCAHQAGRFWEFHDKLFINQEKIAPDYLARAAAEIGLNEAVFQNCLNSDEARAEVENDYQAGLSLGVRATPTWFINGVRIAGSMPEAVFRKVIDEMLK